MLIHVSLCTEGRATKMVTATDELRAAMNAAFTVARGVNPRLHVHSRRSLTARCSRRPKMFEDGTASSTIARAPRPPRVFCAATAVASPDANLDASKNGSPARAFGVGISEDSAPMILSPQERKKTKTRIRQHLNPLAARWRGEITVGTDWYSLVFASPEQPLVVDVGCGKGRFAERLAQSDHTRNVLGLEIRAPLVDEGNERARSKNLGNLAFLACNANVSLHHVLGCAPSGALSVVLCQFCDPWFKKRHAKRRMVDTELVSVVHDALRAAAEVRAGRRIVFVQSDVLPLAEEMRAHLDAHPGFQRDSHAEWREGWVTAGPFAEKTEREICVERKGEHVYRAMYTLAPSGWERRAAEAAQTGIGNASKEDDDAESEPVINYPLL